MSLGSEHTHHHGLLAGAGAGAVAVAVTVPLLFWMVWHRIQGPVGTAILAVVVAVTVLVCGACGYGLLVLIVRGTQHVRHPETCMGRITVTRPMQIPYGTRADPMPQLAPPNGPVNGVLPAETHLPLGAGDGKVNG
jgi:hypothetical protein